MHGVTSQDVIIPQAVAYLQGRALTKKEYTDVLCYYSPHFTTTLLSQISVIEATSTARHYKAQEMRLFFAHDEEILDQDPLANNVNLDDTD